MSASDKNSEQTALAKNAKSKLSSTKMALLRLQEMKAKVQSLEGASKQPIAIVGMSCRFPGESDGPDKFWKFLKRGGDGIVDVPAERWNLEDYYDADPKALGKMYNRQAGFIKNIDRFDAAFFNISNREAALLDPQQRLLLELSWEALENAHIPISDLYGKLGGVFIGMMGMDYAMRQLKSQDIEELDVYTSTGNGMNTAAGRLSYVLGITGPCMTLDTACSSSLVSLHLACQSLRSQECSIAISGGVNAILLPESNVAMCRGGMLSPESHCKTFDESADGYARAEGCGMLVLKRLADAQADGDNILALIRGSATNQDGPSGGLTVPSGPAQVKVIRQALNNAGVRPKEIDYIEAHGTGTPLGDPIETGALNTVFGQGRNKDDPLLIGSVKTNIGHLEGAAGIAGVVKTVLSLQNEEIPPHIHLTQPSSHIPWDDIPLKVTQTLTPWLKNKRKRLAGVSSFGLSGTNSHVILEEAPDIKLDPSDPSQTEEKNSALLLTLSANSKEALKDLSQQYAERINSCTHPETELICQASALKRNHFRHRLALCAENPEALKKQLLAYPTNEKTFLGEVGKISTTHSNKVAFLFTGQGSQYAGMGQDLYHSQKVFKESMDQCHELLLKSHQIKILDIIFSKDKTESDKLNQTELTQPALLAIEYSLAQLWISWGIKPSAVIGHSVGEYTAACVAGVLKLESALAIVAERGRLMQSLPEGGSMIAILAKHEEVLDFIQKSGTKVEVAAVNAPEKIVTTGPKSELKILADFLKKNNIMFKALVVSHAFHSALMEPILEEFYQFCTKFDYKKPKLQMVSNLDGQLMTSAPDAEYWKKHLRQTVMFEKGLRTLHSLGHSVFLEVGPQPVLNTLGKEVLSKDKSLTWLASLQMGVQDNLSLNANLAKLYCAGADLNWKSIHANCSKKYVQLPNYPFQRKRHWFNEQKSSPTPSPQIMTPSASTPTSPVNNPMNQKSFTSEDKSIYLQEKLSEITCKLLHCTPDEMEFDLPLLEMGMDSIVMAQLISVIEETFEVEISIRQVFEELTTLPSIMDFLIQSTSDAWWQKLGDTQVEPKQKQEVASSSMQKLPTQADLPVPSDMQELFKQQLDTVTQLIHRQLDIVRGAGSAEGLFQKNTHVELQQKQKSAPAASPFGQKKDSALSSLADSRDGSDLNETQQKHLDALIKSFTEKTGQSKAQEIKYRAHLSDMRALIAFRANFKEMCYPIVAASSKGSKIIDLDNNEYVDITMGFGVNLLGHMPEFLKKALEAQLLKGIQVGPQSNLAGEVAALICELTGVKKVAFANSGTEAVMAAIRAARGSTKKMKVIMFSGSYHGHSDGTLAVASPDGESSMPMSIGIPSGMLENIQVLPYGQKRSLRIIKEQIHDLAAIIVEPIQSRQPNLRPIEFLRELRELTTQSGTLLIFDEMITGFRLHQAGAQAWFGIEADLVTYGKSLASGLPIGVIAGKSKYMDLFDGGPWQYGDDSKPMVDSIFYGGTFCKHPLAMAACLATMKHLKEEGPELQENLNRRTTVMAEELNSFFEIHEVDLKVIHFGSLFRFASGGNLSYLYRPLELDLFFYHLAVRGVYVWEARTCFLSTAHSEADVKHVIDSVKDSILSLRDGGFFSRKKNKQLSSPQVFDSESIPLTGGQQQLWALTKVGVEGSLAYNLHTSLRLEGGFDLNCMTRALKELMARHEALRMVIAEDGESQRCLATVQVEIPFHDLSSYSSTKQKKDLLQLLRLESQTPFNLSSESPFRVQVIKISEQEHILSIATHHIMVDGWSLMIVSSELSKIYSAFKNGVVAHLAPTAPFREYVAWRKEEDFSKHSTYWKTELNEELPSLNLPTDFSRPAFSSYRGARITKNISTELSQGMTNLAKKNGCTRFMVFLAAYQLWLHRLSSQDKFLVGIPVMGRPSKYIDNLVGYCAHLLPIKSDFSNSRSFLDFLKDTRSTLLSAYEHQDYPFDLIMKDLEMGRSNTSALSSPIHTIFNLDVASGAPQMTGLKASWYPQPMGHTAFDINFNITALGEELIIDLDYSRDLFEESTMQRWLDHFISLCEDFCQDPKQKTNDLCLMNSQQWQESLTQLKATPVDYPKDELMHQLFEAQAKKNAKSIALTFEGKDLSYQELNERANQLADYLNSQLKTLGISSSADLLIGLCLDRSEKMLISLLAIHKVGAAYVPVDPEYPAERIAYMLKDAEVKLLVSEEACLKRLHLESKSYTSVCLDREADSIQKCAKTNLKHSTTPDHIAYVIYTSGSTGLPKGVQIPHRALTNFLCSMAKKPGIKKSDTLLAITTVSFDIVGLELYLPLISGAKVLLASREVTLNPDKLASLIDSGKASVMQGTPATWDMLIKSGYAVPSTLKALVGGEALAQSLAKAIRKNGAELWNLYGPTETTIWSSVYQVGSSACKTLEHSELIGSAIANTQLVILDKNFQPLGQGLPGELCIGGDGLARSYLRRPELDEERFIFLTVDKNKKTFKKIQNSAEGIRLYRTGDLCRRLEDGTIEYLGRLDGQIKIRGFRVELGEIESVLKQQKNNLDAVVVSEGEQSEKRLVAFVVIQDQGSEDPSLWRKELLKQLPEYMVPSAFSVLDKVPLTPAGKVDRKKLTAMASTLEVDSSQSYLAPRNEEEKQLCDLMAEVLKRDRVGVLHGFFEMGGHSLLAVQLISKIKKTFQVEVSLRELFQNPNAETLLKVILAKNQNTAIEINPLKEDEELKLSHAQQRMWFLDQYEGEASSIYNMYGAYLLEGKIDLEALNKSIAELSSRHRILKATFPAVDGKATIQYTSDPSLLSVEPRVNFDSTNRDQVIQDFITTQCSRHFSLHHGPLFMATLLPLEEGSNILVLNMHHIISDGWSVGVLVKELTELYESLAQQKPLHLNDLSIQYHDYANWQRHWLEGQEAKKQEVYWQKQLKDLPELLELPADHPRPTEQSFRGAHISHRISKPVTSELTQLSQQTGSTLYMVLLSAFTLLLSRISGKNDISVGSPIANRHRGDVEGLIGYFANMLVLRNHVNDQLSFIENLKWVRSGCLDAYTNQDLPIDKIVELLQPNRSTSYNPLYQVMLGLQNAPMELPKIKGLKVSSLESKANISLCDLTLNILEDGGELHCEWEYNTDIFDEERIQGLAKLFEKLLSSITQQANQPVYSLAISSDEELLQMKKWNQCQRDYPSALSLKELFEKQVEQNPNKKAIVFVDRVLTYQELNTQANQLARHLSQTKTQEKNLRFGICVERSPEMIIGILAILKAGAAYVPIDSDYPSERLEFMIRDCNLSLLITNNPKHDPLGGDRLKVISPKKDAKKIASLEGSDLITSTGGDDPAYVIYTSGSTGTPKGMTIPHKAVSRLVLNTNYVDLKSSDCLAQASNVSFDAATFEIWGALLLGGTLAILEKESLLDSSLVVKEIKKHQITTMFMTTALFNQYSQQNPKMFNGLRTLLFGGEAVTPKYVENVLKHGGPENFLHVYGPTESTTFATYYPIKSVKKDAQNIPIGYPISNTEIHLLDANRLPVPIGIPGEIYISGEGLSHGYIDRPELNKERFIRFKPEPSVELAFELSGNREMVMYRTGDIASRLKDGAIEYQGRTDHQIKLRGFRIEPGEIEARLKQHELVHETIVSVYQKGEDQKLVGWYSIKNGFPGREKNSSQELTDYLKANLPEYMVPSVLIYVEKMPMNSNGKIDRKVLPAPEVKTVLQDEDLVLSETESRIAKIFEEILELENVGPEDNFFELGGHSLSATMLVSKINDRLGVKIPIKEIFTAPIVADLAEYVDEQLENAPPDSMDSDLSEDEEEFTI